MVIWWVVRPRPSQEERAYIGFGLDLGTDSYESKKLPGIKSGSFFANFVFD